MPPRKNRTSTWLVRLRREQMEQRSRRDHLEREVVLIEVNLKKLKKVWRNMVLKIQLPWIKMDMESMWRRFDHTMDIKNRLICSLLEALDQEEEQNRIVHAAHSEAVDQLLTLSAVRIKDVRRWYQGVLAALCGSASSTRAAMEAGQAQDEEYLQVVHYIAEMRQEESELAAQAERRTRLDDGANKYSKELHLLRGTLEGRMEYVWTTYMNMLLDYHNSSEERRKVYYRLKERNCKYSYQLQHDLERTNKLNLLIKKLQDILERSSGDNQEVLHNLKEERKYFIDAYAKLRQQLDRDRAHDHEQLVRLTDESNKSMKWLAKIAQKGERILTLTSVCRKLETEYEVVVEEELPRSARTWDRSAESDKSARLRKSPRPQNPPTIMEEIALGYSDLENFWRRVGLADMVKMQLARKRKALKLENQHLRAMLCSYLHSVSEQPPLAPSRSGAVSASVVEASHVYTRLL